LVRDALDAQADPAARLAAYQAHAEAELKPYYLVMRNADRSAMRRAQQTLTPGYKPSLKSRLAKSFVEDAIGVAVRSDVNLMREALRGFHMLEHPEAWLKRPRNLAKVLGYWARGRKANAAAYPLKPGPDRAELLPAVGISVDADIERLKAEAA
jgi:hypothetical protein